MSRIFFILLISGLLVSGCVSNTNNNLNHPNSEDSVTPMASIDPPSPLLRGESTAKQISQNIDYNNPIIKEYTQFHINESNRGNYSIKQVFDIWDSTNNNWFYVGHPDNYTFYLNASDLIKGNFRGNCVNFATVISASIESIGGHSRIVKTIGQNGVWHVYPEVLIGTSASEKQPIVDYVTERYSKQMAYWHQEVNSRGDTEYWLNLDYVPKNPGGAHFDDIGAYDVYYPNGNFTWYRISGYAENSPIFPSSLNASNRIVIPQTSSTIPYPAFAFFPFHSSPKEKITVKIITDKERVNVFILNPDNLSIFKGIPETNGNFFMRWYANYVNIENRVFDFIPPEEGDYYLIIYDFPLFPYDANSQTEVNVTTNAISSLINQ